MNNIEFMKGQINRIDDELVFLAQLHGKLKGAASFVTQSRAEKIQTLRSSLMVQISEAQIKNEPIKTVAVKVKKKKERKKLSKMKASTQTLRVAKYLKLHGSITSLDAFTLKYNGNTAPITRLSSEIHKLRKFHGWVIESKEESSENKELGTTSKYARYVYVSGEIE